MRCGESASAVVLALAVVALGGCGKQGMELGGADGLGWSNTNGGKVIAAAFLDAHKHLVQQARSLAAKPLPEPVKTRPPG